MIGNIDRGERPDAGALVGVTEIAKRLKVKPNTVGVWRLRHPSFPDPLVNLSMGPVWWWPDIQEWVESRPVMRRS